MKNLPAHTTSMNTNLPRTTAMKTSRPRKSSLALAGSIAALLAVQSAQAATFYWDTNGNLITAAAATGTWGTDNFWSTDATGATATVAQTIDNTSDVFFSAASNSTGGTVTVSGTQSAHSITFDDATGGITLSGGTAINLGSAAVGSGLFFTNATGSANTISTGITLNSLATAIAISNSGTALQTIGAITGAATTGTQTLTVGSSLAGGITLGGIIGNGGAGGVVALTVNSTNATAPITLSGANTFTGALTLTAGKLIVGSGAANLGAGTLVLNGGTLDIVNSTGATIAFGRNTTVGGAVTIITERANPNPGVTATLGTLSIGANVLTVSGGNITSGTAGLTFGAVTSTGSSTFTVNNPAGGGVTLLTLASIAPTAASTLTFNGTGNTTVTGVVGATTAAVTKAGAGTLTLSGANTYTGTTTLSAGILRATTSASALGAGTLSLGGGTLQLANDTGLTFGRNTTVTAASTITSDRLTSGAGVTHTLGTLSIGAFQLNVTPGTNATGSTAAITFGATTLTGAATLDVAANSTLNLGAVGGAFGFTKQGSGTLIFTGTNTFGTGTAGLTLSAGTVRLGIGYSTGNSTGALLTLNGGTLDLNGTAAQTGNLTGTGGTILNNGANTTLTLGGSNVGGGNFQGVIANGTGTVALTKVGTATITLSGANTYTGATTISASGGSLILGSVNAIQNSSSVSVASGTSLRFSVAGTYATAGTISIAGTGLTGLSNPGALWFGQGGSYASTLNAPIAMTAAATISSYGNVMTQTLGGAITGTGPLTIASQGGTTADSATWTLNAASSYSGNTIINAVGGAKDVTVKLGIANALPTTTSLNLQASNSQAVATFATLDLNGFNQTLAGLTDTGGAMTQTQGAGKRLINSSATLATLTINNAGAVTYGTTGTNIIAGTIGGTTAAAVAANNLALTKSGAGTLTLSGTNTYTGATLVNVGSIDLGNIAALGTTAAGTTVASGARVTFGTLATASTVAEPFDIAGTGTAANGVLNVGGSKTINLSGAITLSANATVSADGGAAFNFTSASGISGTNVSLTFQTDGSVASSITGPIALGTGGLTKTSTSSLTLSGNNTYTGTTTISGGTLILGNVNALQNTSGISMAAATTLRNNVTGTTIAAPITLSGAGSITFLAGVAAGSTTNLNGAIGGATGNVIYSTTTNSFNNQSSVFVLGAAGTYTGNTLISTGDGVNNPVFLRAGTGIVNALPVTTVLTFDGIAGAGTGRVFQYDLNGNDQTLAGLTNTVVTLRREFFTNSGALATLTINNTADMSFGGSSLSGASTNRAQITGAIALTKSGAGTFTLGGTLLGGATVGGNTFTGDTKILGGILSLGETISLQNSAFDTLNSIAGDATNGLRTTVTALTLGGLTGNKNLADVFTTTTGGYSGLTALTLNPGTGTTPSYSGSIADGAAGMTLTKTGAGAQTLSGANSYTGVTTVNAGTLTLSGANTSSGATTVNAGTLKLDYSTQDNSKLSDSAVLTLGNATLDLSGGTHVESVASTTLTAGTASSVTSSTPGAVLEMNAITRGAGATITFGAPGIATTDTANVNGILGFWAMINGTDWAANSTNGLNGLITAPTYTDVTRLIGAAQVIADGSATNVRIIEGAGGAADITLGAATTTVNSVTQSDSGGTSAGTIDPNGQTLRTDGILLGTGAGGLTIGIGVNNGFLTTATAGGELLLINNTANGLTINSIVADNTTSTLTKTGSGAVTLTGINTYAGATTISAGTLTIADGSIATSSNIVNNATLVYNLNTSARTYANVISGTGTLTKSGTNTLTLTGVNTYTGTTTIGAGILNANSTDALGSGVASNTLIFTGGTLQAGGTITSPSTRLVTLTSTGVIDTNGNSVSIAGVASGAGGLTKNGVGTLTLSATNTFTGPITINGGTLDLTATGAAVNIFGSTQININGASTLRVTSGTSNIPIYDGKTYTFDAAGGGSILVGTGNYNAGAGGFTITTLGGARDTIGLITTSGGNGFNLGTVGGTFDVALGSDATSDLTVTPIISNSGAVTKTGAGRLTFTGANTYTGSTTLNASSGTLDVSGTGSLGGGTYAGAIAIGTGSTLKFSSSVAASTQTLSGAITGLGALTFAPSVANANLSLTNAGNNYSGLTTISAGRVAASPTAGVSANTSFAITGNATSGGQLFLSATGTVANNLSIAGVGFVEADALSTKAGAIRFATTGSNLSGTVTLSGDARVGNINGTGSATISGQITGSAGIEFYGAINTASVTHTYTLSNSGVANDYTGNTTITAADYSAVRTGGVTVLTLGVNDQIPNGIGKGNVVFSGADANHISVLEMNGKSETINGLSNIAAAGAIIRNNFAGASVLTIGDADTTSSFSGTITNTTGTLALTKIGTGTLTLSGLNSFAGDITVSDGILVGTVAGSGGNSAFGSQSNTRTITVGSGATLRFDIGNMLSNNNFASTAVPTLAITGTATNNFANNNALNNVTLTGGTLTATAGSATYGAFNINGTVTSTGASLISTSDAVNGKMMLSNTGTIFDVTSDTLTISAPLAAVTREGHTGALIKNGAGTLVLSGANTYSGSTTLNAGTTTVGAGGTLGSGQAALAVNGATTILNLATAVDTTVGSLSGTDAAANINNGGVGRNFTVNQTAAGSFAGVIAGAGSFTLGSLSTSTLTLAGPQSYTGSTTVNAGTLKLAYSAGTSKFSDSAVLVFGGGTVELSDGGTPHTEAVASTTLTAGTASRVTSTLGTSVLQMNAITPSVGASIDFGAASIATTDNTNDITGILGSWATVGGADWAINSTGLADGLITAYTAYTDVQRLTAGTIADGAATNVRIIEGAGVSDITLGAATTTVNTLNQSISGGTSAATIDPAGQTLRTGSILVGTGAGALTIGNGVNNGTLTAATGGGNLSLINNSGLTINSVIADNATSSLSKSGTGTLILSAANTYTGATVINGGTVSLTGSLTGGGAITVSGSAVLSESAAGVISGASSLTLASSGTSTLNGVNVHTGGTIVSAGNLILGDASALGTGPFTLSGGNFNTDGVVSTLANNNAQNWNANFTFGGASSLDLGTGAVTLNANSQVTVTANTLTVGGVISGAFGIAKAGAGTLVLNGANLYSGGTTITGATDAGILVLGNANALGTGPLTINGNSANIIDSSVPNLVNAGNNAQNWQASFAFAGTQNLDLGTGAVTMLGNRTVTVAANTLTIGGAISGPGYSLTKAGAGTMVLGGAGTFTGSTTVSGGTLRLANTGALASTSGINLGTANTRLELGTDSAFTTLPGIVGASSLTHTIVSDRATAGAALNHQLGTINFGASTFNFIQGTNVTSGTAGLTFTSATMTSGGAGTSVLNPTTATLTITGGVTGGGNNVARTLELGGTGTGHSIGGAISNGVATAMSLTKSNTSTWTLSGANIYTGTTLVSLGTLNVTGITTGTGNVTVGNIVGNAVLNVQSGATLSGTSPTLTLGTGGAGSVGALNIIGGIVNVQATDADTISYGASNGGYGSLFMSSGSLTQQRFMFGGTGSTTAAGGVGVGLQTGGTVNSTGWMILGRAGASTGVYTITNGTLNHAGAVNDIAIGLQGTGRAELNVAGGLIDNTGRRVDFSGGTTGSFAWTGTGLLNLNAGTLLTNAIFYSSGTAYANFNGGTLRAAATNAAFMNAITTGGAYVNGAFGTYAGGAVIDTNTFNATIAAALLAPTGDGVTTIAVTSGGSGYVGAPYVQITGGGGAGATGYATIDQVTGAVTGIVITNPGIGYTSAPAVALVGGGGSGTVLGTATTAANTSGGLTKTGAGTLTLTGTNTYTGATNISQGNLVISGTGVIANTATNTITIGNTGILTMDRADTWGSSGSGAPLIPIVISAGGTMTNSGSRFNTLGPLTLNGGTLTTTGGANINFPSWALRGTVTVGGSVASTISAGTGSFNAINLGANTVTGSTFNVADVTGDSNADLTVSAVLQNGGNAGNVAQASSLTKTGVGTMTLSGANTYSGNTTVSNGTLTLAGATGVGTAGGYLYSGLATTGNVTVASGAQIVISSNNSTVHNALGFGTSQIWTVDGTINSTGGDAHNIPGTVTLNNGTLTGITNASFGTFLLGSTYSGTITANGSSNTISAANFGLKTGLTLTLSTPLVTDALSVSSVLGVNANSLLAGAVTKTGLGTVTLSGANIYTGLTTVSAGTLNLNTTGANSLSGNLTVSGGSAVLQQSDQIANASNVVVGGGTLAIAGNSDTVNGVQLTSGSITGSGGTLASATAFDLQSGSASAILGGTLGASKTTAGTVTLTGANTYTGTTTISGGILNVNADAALGSSSGAVDISNGATLQAGGTVSTGARTLALGTGGGVIDTNSNVVNFNIGSTVTGSTLTKTGAGTLNFDMGSTLTGLGALAANNGTTNVNTVLGTGGTSTVSVTNATTLKFGSVSQTLSSLTIGAGSTVVFTSGTASGAFSEGGGKGASLSGSAVVPEPGTIGLLLVGALGVLNRRRRQA